MVLPLIVISKKYREDRILKGAWWRKISIYEMPEFTSI